MGILAPMTPPGSEEELIARARALAGKTLGEVADVLSWPLPQDLTRAKGGVGQLLERALGADGSSLPRPDFDALCVELKTLPVDGRGRPRESTFVCTASPRELAGETWPTSRVRAKLACVLWLPVEADKAVPLAARRVGAAVLWRPDAAEEALLRADWEDLADLCAHGLHDAITARRGQVLQLRPKARDARARQAIEPVGGGGTFSSLPRGFYLRRAFTTAVLARHLALPSGRLLL